MEQVSILLKGVFVMITLLAIIQFYRASGQSKSFLIIIFIWMTIQLILGLTNFYEDESTVPPRFGLLFVPPVLLIISMFITKSGQDFMNRLDIKQLTLLHTIRIPVEFVLYFLFLLKAIPQIMTFEGRNFDIIAGLTAPIIFYFGFYQHKIPNKILILWNIICLGLLMNIIIIALLSTKTFLQKFGFDQPNIAIAYFPFNWLPSVVVPLVLFSHLASIRQLSAALRK